MGNRETDNLEMEFKYPAKDIKLSDFKKILEEKDDCQSSLVASGFDKFYSSPNTDSFYRHRKNDNFNQLTFKSKTEKNNTYIRKEYNIDLGSDVSDTTVEGYCGEQGFLHDFTIFKNAFIYFYEQYSIVYYICYDEDMNELGRFIEIELDEKFEWESKNKAWNFLLLLEKMNKKLGAAPDNRIKESLFDLWRKHE